MTDRRAQPPEPIREEPEPIAGIEVAQAAAPPLGTDWT
jgi:hypothetical protein